MRNDANLKRRIAAIRRKDPSTHSEIKEAERLARLTPGLVRTVSTGSFGGIHAKQFIELMNGDDGQGDILRLAEQLGPEAVSRITEIFRLELK